MVSADWLGFIKCHCFQLGFSLASLEVIGTACHSSFSFLDQISFVDASSWTSLPQILCEKEKKWCSTWSVLPLISKTYETATICFTKLMKMCCSTCSTGKFGLNISKTIKIANWYYTQMFKMIILCSTQIFEREFDVLQRYLWPFWCFTKIFIRDSEYTSHKPI